MKFKQVTDNGNIALRREDLALRRNSQNISWTTVNTDFSNLYENRTGNRQLISNCNNIYESNESTEIFKNYSTGTEPELEIRDRTNEDLLVCNKQYRINTKNNVNLRTSTESTNLEGATETVLASRESFLGDTDVHAFDYTPVDDRAFELSDTDDMSENGIRAVPRGIVNPNYPGFHHLAHTLQDYSSNIENFYHSENEMTDDDVDIEITELTYEPEPNQNESPIEYKNINNNNINDDKTSPMRSSPQKTSFSHTTILDSHFKNEMPDLLKTISKNNNNLDSFNYDINCTDTDIENNFHTKDIIGDFNKEIEDEIKQLLNYNINIQDDLEELRKDIKDTLAKPIETTINNISDVVNHVIKKLVETHVEPNEDTISNKREEKTSAKEKNHQENIDINKENETNTRTEMNLSRPTFLFIDNNTNSKIKDAFLSDGKEEINVNDYDPDKLSQNVENTIKQLSTELRKIIPKLDEMRERDRLWAESNKESSVITDGNSNEIASSSNCFSFISTDSIDKIDACKNLHNEIHTIKNKPVKALNEPKTIRDRQKEVNSSKNYFPNAQSNTSVRKNDSPRDYEFGSFDVYNIETALPKLDLDAIENHLKAAKEAERRSFVTNIRRKLSKTSDEINYNKETEKTGFKKSLHLFKLKLLKSDVVIAGSVPVANCDDTALSPRAIGTAECAQTEIEWPILADNNPNILEKFTRIVTITDNVPYDKKKRNDREEIRKRLAMGADAEEYYSMGHTDRPGKKPSLHSRLQSGMNLQICFMNETASDNESQASEMERNLNYNNKSLTRSSIFSKTNYNHPYQTRPLSVNITKHDKISTVQSGAKLRPSSLMLKPTKSRSAHSLGHIELKESDFYALQATLQTEARIALAQAKEMARIQMERERRRRGVSPVTEMVQRGMTKANAPLAPDRRRVSRQLLTDMNIAQLQVIVNELHSQIESLNDSLVKLLMARDELHMGQDSMLVDIEDLTRYLGVKEQTKKTKGTTKSGMKRLASLVHK